MNTPTVTHKTLVQMAVLLLVCGSAVLAQSQPNTTDWFHDARWGVMTHYLGAPPSTAGGAELTAEQWNRQVDAFDVPGLADQVASTGAKYLLFTLGQNSGHYCARIPRMTSWLESSRANAPAAT